MKLFPDPNHPEFALIQLFRTEPGDLGIPDVPWIPQERSSLDDVAIERLASYHRDASRPSRSKPTQSYALDRHDNVVAEYRMMPTGAVRVR